MFSKGNGSQKFVLMVYVDDLIIMSPKNNTVEKTKNLLRHKFKLEDLVQLRYYFGINFDRASDHMVLSKSAHCWHILKRNGTEQAAYCRTPIVTNIDDLLKNMDFDEAKTYGMADVPYRALVGSLLYLGCHTRPDIPFAVGVLAIFVENPSRLHWEAGKSILLYLDGTLDHGIVFGSVEPVVLQESEVESQSTAYCDSDWAGNVSDRKSTGSYLPLLNGGAVTWKPREQKCSAGSSTQAEYIALSKCVRELRFFRKFMYELGFETDKEVVYEDNQKCMR